jgi:hypothetical protein
MKYGGLKCSACGADLELRIAYDGMGDEAERCDKLHSEWGWVVSLDCTSCARTFPICRTPKEQFVSELKTAD